MEKRVLFEILEDVPLCTSIEFTAYVGLWACNFSGSAFIS